MIYVDWPLWPAHGTHWAHLVSDTSLDELHDFARGAGIASRAFDLDHYDVAGDRLPALVAAGAVQVAPKELLARLQGSGLRVPGRDRPAESLRRRDHDLRRRWSASLDLVRDDGDRDAGADAGHPRIDADHWGAVGAGLLARWSEPHRRYHDLTHLHAVLGYLDTLREGGEHVTAAAVLAAWFHDAVYEGRAGEDEENSARLAEHEVVAVGAGAALAAETARLVRITATHLPQGAEDPACALIDADLAVLGAPPAHYEKYATAVRSEYAAVPEAAFREGRARILEGFLTREHIYRTLTARGRWEARARANLTDEIARLRR